METTSNTINTLGSGSVFMLGFALGVLMLAFFGGGRETVVTIDQQKNEVKYESTGNRSGDIYRIIMNGDTISSGIIVGIVDSEWREKP